MLAKHPEKCRFPHGHSRTVELILEAETLDGNEMVCDFKLVKELMEGFLDTYDHALCMNTDDPEYARMKAAYGERVIGFEGRDPTTELLAKTIYDHFQMRRAEKISQPPGRYALRPEVRLARVRVSETSSSWAEYWE